MLCRGSGGFIVQERGSLSLTRIALDPSATFDLSGGASLSFASMAVLVAISIPTGASLIAHDATLSNALVVSGAASLSGCTLETSASLAATGGSLSLVGCNSA